MPVPELVLEPVVRTAWTTCPEYGRHSSCASHSSDLEAVVEDVSHATAVCLCLAPEHHDEPDPALNQRLAFRQGRRLVADELLAGREDGLRIAGCSACPTCQTCSAAKGGYVFRQPERLISSFESQGVDVVELLRSCFAINWEWAGSDSEVGTLHAVGAVSYRRCLSPRRGHGCVRGEAKSITHPVQGSSWGPTVTSG